MKRNRTENYPRWGSDLVVILVKRPRTPIIGDGFSGKRAWEQGRECTLSK